MNDEARAGESFSAFHDRMERDHANKMARNTRRSNGHCEVCRTYLLQPGGYCGTGLCGPCCTGEADTVDKITDTRTKDTEETN